MPARLATTDEISAYVYNRGLALEDSSAESFAALLAKPEHKLSEDEIESVEEILGEVSDPDSFDVASAFTADLNGKQALFVEGLWRRSKTGMLKIYLDIQGQGRFVQELSFSAPKEEYDRQAANIRVCFQSIVWKR